MTWVGALEGSYGAPWSSDDRLDLVRWLPSVGISRYAYAPKADPWLRDRWRDPWTTDHLDHFAELAHVEGVMAGVVLSPGTDRLGGDEQVLLAKLAVAHDQGIRWLGIAFDDTPAGGSELGAEHAALVQHVIEEMPPDVTWATCPVDYAAARPTPYLEAFLAGLPPAVEVMWTGPGVVSAEVDEPPTSGDEWVFADNFPVSDGPMSGVLHLGPYPGGRATTLRRRPLLLNCSALPRASRIGLAVGSRWWHGDDDREQAWSAAVAAVPGLEPLATACRSWWDSPGPAPSLLADLAAGTLAARLAAGCRAGLATDWQLELEPWLAAWELEVFAMGHVAGLVGGPPTTLAWDVAEAQRRLRMQEQQVFGIRYACYPLSHRDADGRELPDPRGLVQGRNLTDLVCEQALGTVW